MDMTPGDFFFGWGWLAGIGALVLLGVFLLPWFFFLLNLQNLLQELSPANRRMTPSLVWLNFIPLFQLGWFIYTVVKVRESIEAEFQARGWLVDEDLGYNVGLTAGILWIAALFIGWIPFIGWVLPLAGLICWIIYWLKIADLKRRLEVPPLWGRPGAHPPAYPPGYPPPAAPPARPYATGYPQPQVPPPAPEATGGAATGAAVAGAPPPEERPAEEAPADSEEARCAACGSKFDPDDQFCRSCGMPLPK